MTAMNTGDNEFGRRGDNARRTHVEAAYERISRLVDEIFDIDDDPEGPTAKIAVEVSKIITPTPLFDTPFITIPNAISEDYRCSFLANTLNAFKKGVARNQDQYTAPVPGPELETVTEVLRPLLTECTGTQFVSSGWGSYAHYAGDGSRSRAHLDQPRFGEATALLMLDHHPPSDASSNRTSQTRFITRDGVQSVSSTPGSVIIFDGRFLPHGRTSLQSGEAITLALIGLVRA
ncbi:hypothetical protein [Nocardia barduliensis]|uniref:hypothetical protein n=1 Tax=Nocardia barduliensis TaxID=2736643 RepID=UPI00157416D1|nr:hypothetical protein [Nocardia barduliensis]